MYIAESGHFVRSCIYMYQELSLEACSQTLEPSFIIQMFNCTPVIVSVVIT